MSEPTSQTTEAAGTPFDDFRGRLERIFANIPGDVGGGSEWKVQLSDVMQSGNAECRDSSDEEAEEEEAERTRRAGVSSYQDMLDSEAAAAGGGERRLAVEEENTDCLASDDEGDTEEEVGRRMMKVVGKCRALDKEDEMDASDCQAMGLDSPTQRQPLLPSRKRGLSACDGSDTGRDSSCRGFPGLDELVEGREVEKDAFYSEVMDDNVWDQRCRKLEAEQSALHKASDKSMPPPPPRAAPPAASSSPRSSDDLRDRLNQRRTKQTDDRPVSRGGGDRGQPSIHQNTEKIQRASEFGWVPEGRLPNRNVPSHVKRDPSKWLCYALDQPIMIGGPDDNNVTGDNKVAKKEMRREIGSETWTLASTSGGDGGGGGGGSGDGEHDAEMEIAETLAGSAAAKPVFRPRNKGGNATTRDPKSTDASQSGSRVHTTMSTMCEDEELVDADDEERTESLGGGKESFGRKDGNRRHVRKASLRKRSNTTEDGSI